MATTGMSPATQVVGTVDDQLRALLARGFRFVDPRDERGDVVAVVGVRADANIVDIVQLHGEDDAIATRMPANEDPLAPRHFYWRERGPAAVVLAKLLHLVAA